jgi:hypothetical protein
MNASLVLGRIAGIRIGVHWSWLVVFVLIVWSLATSVFPEMVDDLSDAEYLAMALVAAVLFFVSLLAHEYGHALTARREGMEIEGINLWLFGGVAQFRGMFPSAGAEFRIAIAGPAVSLVLGVVFLAASWAVDVSAPGPSHALSAEEARELERRPAAPVADRRDGEAARIDARERDDEAAGRPGGHRLPRGTRPVVRGNADVLPRLEPGAAQAERILVVQHQRRPARLRSARRLRRRRRRRVDCGQGRRDDDRSDRSERGRKHSDSHHPVVPSCSHRFTPWNDGAKCMPVSCSGHARRGHGWRVRGSLWLRATKSRSAGLQRRGNRAAAP